MMMSAVEYKALTRIHLPVIEKDYAPGDTVSAGDLEAAGQTDENIQELVNGGSLGGPDDDLHPSTIVPDPAMPTIESAINDAKQVMEQMQVRGEEIPAEVKALAELDYQHATTGDTGQAGDASA